MAAQGTVPFTGPSPCREPAPPKRPPPPRTRRSHVSRPESQALSHHWLLVTDQAQNWALKAAVDRASTPCATKSHSFRDRNSERGLPPPRCGPSSCKVIKANESICTTLDCKTETGDEEVENKCTGVKRGKRQGGMN